MGEESAAARPDIAERHREIAGALKKRSRKGLTHRDLKLRESCSLNPTLRTDSVSPAQSPPFRRIWGDGRGKRSSTTRLDDAAELPSGRGPAQNTRNALGPRHAPGVASLKILRHVEIRGPAPKPRIEYIERSDPIL